MSLDIPTPTPYSRDRSASHTPVFPPHDPAGLDMDMGSFAALTPLSATSTTNSHFDTSTTAENSFQSSFDSSNPTGTGAARAHQHYYTHRGTASAPAHIAFGNPYHSSSSNHHHSSQQHGINMGGGMNGINPMNMSSEPSSPLRSELDFDVSPLTSPWLGAKMSGSSTGGAGSSGRVQAYGHHHTQYHPHAAVQAGTKRAASPSSADIDVDVVFGGGSTAGEVGRPRKRQASISQSSNTMRSSISPAIRPANSNSNPNTSSSRGSGSGSRSMNSTPLMGGINPNRTRKGSVAMNNPLAMGMGGTGYSGVSSPLVGSNTSSSTIRGMSRNSGNSNNHHDNDGSNSNIGFGVVGDSPSPVDLSLSMPPPVAPASAFGTGTGMEVPQSLVPVTPASIMNLGGSFVGLGGGLSNNGQAQMQTSSSSGSRDASASTSANTSASVPSAKNTTKGTGRGANAKNDKDAGSSGGPTAGTKKSGRKAASNAAGDNTGLKHILPGTYISVSISLYSDY